MTGLTIGAVIFPGFEMLDYYGPLELFSMHRDDFTIRAVAQTGDPVPASGGPATLPDAVFADGTAYDILLVPGGAGVRVAKDDAALLGWLAQACGAARIVSSVCTGSLLLARSGVLAGRKATTNKMAFDWVRDHSDGVDWQPSARWVKDDKFYTSSGVSAGMDMTLALLSDLLGDAAAQQAATAAEYIRNDDPDNDPFAVKDHPQ